MASIYIISDKGKLGKKDETFVFSQPDGSATILFPFKTEILFLVGNVSISGDALRMLSKYKIPVVFLSSNGKFNSKLVYSDSKNVFLRQKQYLTLSDPEKSCAIARSIVEGKLKNQISFMQRIKRKQLQENDQLEENINRIKNLLAKVPQAQNTESLRGIEGMAAKKYFEVFAFNINCKYAVFKTRSKNPPESNVNAVLSFLYTLLAYRVEAAVESQGLDTMVGNLHLCDYGRASLVFDLVEEFRTPIADAVCCALFNFGTLKEVDFEEKDFEKSSEDFPLEKDGEDIPEGKVPASAKKGILLTKDGIKKVLKAFEDKLNTQITYDDEKISYQKIIINQVKHYKRVISGEELAYRSFYFK